MIIAADNLRVTQPPIAKAIEQMDPAPIAAMARRCVDAGADWIDINPGPLTRDPAGRMTFLVETVSAVTSLPLMLDTVNPAAMAAGLAAGRSNRIILNGFSLEPAKLAHILPLARQYGCEIVGYLLTPDSQVPVAEEECIAVAVELYSAFQTAGLANAQLIIDPVVAPLIWADGPRHNRHLLTLLRTLPDLLGFPVRTIAGLSNLTAGRMPGKIKQAMQRTYLPMLAVAGLNIILLDIDHPDTIQTARTCTQLLENDIIALSGGHSGGRP